MRKIFWFCVFLLCSADFLQAELVWSDLSCGNTGITSILIDSVDPGLLYAGSKAGVLKSRDGGNSWHNVLSLRGGDAGVNLLSFDPLNNNIIYASTSRGLYSSSNRGGSWLRIFRRSNYLEADCTAVAVLPGIIYLGTRGGLFASRDKGRSWSRENGRVGGEDIKAVAYSAIDKVVYAASCGGIYRAAPAGNSWERIFVAYAREDKEYNEEPDEEEKTGDGTEINYLTVAPASGDIYIATRTGIYQSSDRGKSWEALTDYGLLSRNVKFIYAAWNSRVYAVTSSGIFLYSGERWQELSFALAAGEPYAVNCSREGNLYAACQMGLFRASIKESGQDNNNNGVVRHCQGEPSINEVQQAAIKYAEVEPEKIMRWRKQATKKAFLPQLSLSVDSDTGDLWHWETGSSVKSEDDILRKGRSSVDWSVTCKWDLAELIWNSDQTSIDVRSRLMVELRNDILDEVTRVYFERMRVKTELEGLSIEESNKRQIKELRVAELTALLDAMTGGYFSRAFKQ